MFEMVAQRGFHNARGFGGGKLVFGLALKFRFANENRNQRGGGAHYVFGGDERRFFIVHPLGIGF